ncbi:MAG: DedA family protein [Bacteroidota bacterium]
MLDLLHTFLDFILHIDVYLQLWVSDYRTWTYAFLFLIIFCETGLVVTPFLPGDSLLFAAGTIAAMDGEPLNVFLLVIVLMTATFLGDNSNYFIGKFLGQKVYEKDYRLIKRKYLDKTHSFYEKHGGKTIIIARFMPIIRTFAPFVAGVGSMTYLRFLSFSVIGNILWVNFFIWLGYFFGNTEIVKTHFSLVILSIIFISILPPIIGIIKHKYFSKTS